jgi:hypothetical protein
MQLTIGCCRLLGTDGVISVRGDDQIAFEWGRFDYKLLLTMDLYDVSGCHIARLRRNQWTFNDRDRFEFAANTTGVSIVDTKSSQVVIEARVESRDAVVVTQGVFNSSAGRQIEITNEDWDRGVSDTQTATLPGASSTNPPFAKDEIERIRQAVLSSQETVECPRCGGPLTRTHLPGNTQTDTCLVACIMCGRNLVVRSQS